MSITEDQYFEAINNNYTDFSKVNFIWTIPYKLITPSPGYPTEDEQSYEGTDYLRTSPKNPNDFDSVVESFPVLGIIITPSWYCSDVFVAVNRYDPKTFNQIYLDNKDSSNNYWQVSNSGGIDKGAYWLYLAEGSAIYMYLSNTLRAMNKVHAIYKHLASVSPTKDRNQLLNDTLDQIIQNSQTGNMNDVYVQYKSLFSSNSAKRNYFVLDDQHWEDYLNTVSKTVSDTGNSIRNFLLGIINILTDESVATNNYPLTNTPLNGLYVYYAQEFNNMGKSGAVNPVDPYLKDIAHNYGAIMMFANWNSSALWTCEILHKNPNTDAPKMFYFKNNNSYSIVYNNRSGCFKIDNNDGFKELSNYPTLKDGAWPYIYSPDVSASNYNGQGIPTYETKCANQLQKLRSLYSR